jgi:hypothetical protein
MVGCVGLFWVALNGVRLACGRLTVSWITLVWFEKVQVGFRCFFYTLARSGEARYELEIFPRPSAVVRTRNRSRPTTEPAVTEARVLLHGRRNCFTDRTGEAAGIFYCVRARPTSVA